MRVIEHAPPRRHPPPHLRPDDRGGRRDLSPPPKRQLPPLSPRGFAVDTTPGKSASLEGRGAAMLRRGSFQTFLEQHDAKLKPAEKKAQEMLATNRHQLLLPQNQKYLDLLQRTTPDSDLHKSIQSNPHTATQHELLKASLTVPADTRGKLQAKGLTDDEIDRLAAGHMQPYEAIHRVHQLKIASAAASIPAMAEKAGLPADQFHVDPVTGQVAAPTHSGIVDKFFQGADQAIIGTAPFLYHMATTDPRKSLPEFGQAVGHSFGETFTHPIRQLEQDPFALASNIAAVGSAGLGVAGRVGAASEAMSAARAGEVSGAETAIRPNIAEQASQMTPLRAAAHGYLHPRVRNMLDLRDQRNPELHAKENSEIAETVQQAFDSLQPKIKGVRGRMISTAREIGQGVGRTWEADSGGRAAEIRDKHAAWLGGQTSSGMAAGGEAIFREMMDGVRAGTIYLRPAYLPNNWAGNTFMNLVHQGFLAPVNLAKSVVASRHLNARELRGLDALGGQTSLRAITGPRGKGYVRALTDPLVRTMGKAADVPFRRAAVLHELRRDGYRTLDQVKQVLREADGNPEKLRELADAGRRAQEEVVKFGKLSDVEQGVIKNLFFVWNWTKGAVRYGVRFPVAHPLTTAGLNAGAPIGNEMVQRRVGGLPQYLVGSIPVGHGKLANPFTLNPLGTAVQVGQAVRGVRDIARGKFDPHTESDAVSLMNPLWQGYEQARSQSGGRGYFETVARNIAPYKLAEGIMHPGSGSIFPGTAKEAWGHFIFGSLYPRRYDPQAMTAALERMNINHPAKLIPAQIDNYEKKTGQKIDPKIVTAYMKDLEALQQQKDFKKSYANQHNAPSYKRLPPQNQFEAAITFLQKYSHLPPDAIKGLRDGAKDATTDQEFTALANSAWAMTATGEGKRTWDALMQQAKSKVLTRKK